MFIRFLILYFLLSAIASATSVAQFRARDFATVWPSAHGMLSLVPVHVAVGGWGAPQLSGKGVSFSAAGTIASPLQFSENATGTVAHVLIVADCDEPRSWSTLLDASVGADLAPRPFPWDNAVFSSGNALGAASISVDGAEQDRLFPTNGLHLAEVVFPSPLPASDLYLGGHPATPHWNRAWTGRVYEAIFCFSPPTDSEREALRTYLSLRWDLGFPVHTRSDTAQRLAGLGVMTDGLFSSLLLFR